MSSETISYPHLEREQQPHDDHLFPKLATEFIGTFFLVFSIGICQGTNAPIAIGFTLVSLVFMGGHISGAHYNPCVSLSVFLRQSLSLRELFYYCAVQFAAALVAAGIVNAITGTHFAPRPGVNYAVGHAFACEVLWTFILISVILNVATTKSQEDNSYFGLAIGAILAAGAVAVGPVSGACFNPAVGTGLAIVDGANGGDSAQYLWLYWLGPILGSILASGTFRITNAREFKKPVTVIGRNMSSSADNFTPLLQPDRSNSTIVPKPYTT